TPISATMGIENAAADSISVFTSSLICSASSGTTSNSNSSCTQRHQRAQLSLLHRGVDTQHGDLDQVGGGALQRRIHCRPFGKSSLVRVTRLDVGYGTDAAKRCTHRLVAAHIFQCLFDECCHTGVASEIR